MTLPVIGITGRTDQSARPPNSPLFATAQTYVQAAELNGGAPVIIPPHLEETKLRAIFQHLKGLILSGWSSPPALSMASLRAWNYPTIPSASACSGIPRRWSKASP